MKSYGDRFSASTQQQGLKEEGWVLGEGFRTFARSPMFENGERIALQVEIQTPWMPDRADAQRLLVEMASASGANFVVESGVSEQVGKGLYSACGLGGVFWVPKGYATCAQWHAEELMLSQGVAQVARELMSPNLGRRTMEARGKPSQESAKRSFWSLFPGLFCGGARHLSRGN